MTRTGAHTTAFAVLIVTSVVAAVTLSTHTIPAWVQWPSRFATVAALAMLVATAPRSRS